MTLIITLNTVVTVNGYNATFKIDYLNCHYIKINKGEYFISLKYYLE